MRSFIGRMLKLIFSHHQVAFVPFRQFFEDKNYRLVVVREKNKEEQTNIFTGDDFIYHSILTNDYESHEEQIITYYNMRGAIEKNFNIQNNGFGWGHLPRSYMNNNTVYLILTAMIKKLFELYRNK